MVDLGLPKKFLGLEIVQNPGEKSIFLHLKSFAEKTLKNFGMYDFNSTLTPIITHETKRKLKHVQNINNDLDISKILFRQAIGTSLYLINDIHST